MKRITLLLMALGFGATVGFAQGNRIVCDETCRIEYQKTETSLPKQAETAKTGDKARPAVVPGYAVVSPVGRTSVEMISQAPRLESLDGKTIAVVGVSFMTGITHPEIKRLINEHYPSAKVLLLDEIGFSGPYPAPGVTRKQNEDFKRNLRDMKVDAVISGNGGCGLCTPKETGSCITAEYLGIPSVIIAGPGFADQARYTARNNGVPVMRVAEYPGAFAADSGETLLKNTREILWPQIVEALTKPITADEIACAEKAGSVVTLGSTLLWGNNMAPSTTDPQKVMELLAWDISERCQFALGSGKQFTFRTILMTDPVRHITKRYFLSEKHTTKSSGHFCPRRRFSLCMTLKKNSMPEGEVSIRR